MTDKWRNDEELRRMNREFYWVMGCVALFVVFIILLLTWLVRQ